MIKFRVKVVEQDGKQQHFLQVVDNWLDWLLGDWQTLGYVDQFRYDLLPKNDEKYPRKYYDDCKKAADMYLNYHYKKNFSTKKRTVTYIGCEVFGQDRE